MSSLISFVASGGVIKRGDNGDDVRTLQLALSQAGYKVGIDGDFGPQTEAMVYQFQGQHGLVQDGEVGPRTAAILDLSHQQLVETATPWSTTNVDGVAWPHDDTASLLAFYGKPWEDDSLLEFVSPPFKMYYGPQSIARFRFHVKGIAAMNGALARIWYIAGKDDQSPILKHVRNFSGTYNYRPIRGSSRLSCHAFGAAIDFDAKTLPLAHDVPAAEMPQEVVDAFKSQGFFWGGDYRGRKDPMHFQLAHE